MNNKIKNRILKTGLAAMLLSASLLASDTTLAQTPVNDIFQGHYQGMEGNTAVQTVNPASLLYLGGTTVEGAIGMSGPVGIVSGLASSGFRFRALRLFATGASLSFLQDSIGLTALKVQGTAAVNAGRKVGFGFGINFNLSSYRPGYYNDFNGGERIYSESVSSLDTHLGMVFTGTKGFGLGVSFVNFDLFFVKNKTDEGIFTRGESTGFIKFSSEYVISPALTWIGGMSVIKQLQTAEIDRYGFDLTTGVHILEKKRLSAMVAVTAKNSFAFFEFNAGAAFRLNKKMLLTYALGIDTFTQLGSLNNNLSFTYIIKKRG